MIILFVICSLEHFFFLFIVNNQTHYDTLIELSKSEKKTHTQAYINELYNSYFQKLILGLRILV